MYNYHKKIQSFHEDHVRLTRVQQDDMSARRHRNVKRIREGLKENGKPAFDHEIKQGGYAHLTMVQPPEANQESRYDIDNAIVFAADDADVAPATARERVRAAIAKKGTGFKDAPVAKQKCVRVTYSEGYQCDFPVMRCQKDSAGKGYDYELAAGDEWLARDSTEITSWVFKQVASKSPEGDGSYQLRRIIRLMKFYAKTHAYHNRHSFPAGIVMTALVIKHYVAKSERDDLSFRETLRAIENSASTPVYADQEEVSDKRDEDRIERLIAQTKESLEELDTLDADDTTEAQARKAWRKVFRHSFFDASAQKSDQGNSASAGGLATAAIAATVASAATATAQQTDQMERHRQERLKDDDYSKPWAP